jgi:gamma-glutamylcyclotransferase (GGCT)/AIG2-like uncharacterized protein YtfP
MDGQQFVGEARTQPGFVLYGLGDYPGMVSDPGDKSGVRGEVWSVDDACLRRLDELEGTEEGYYARVPVALEAPFSGAPVETYIYLRSTSGRPLLGSEWVG